MLMAMDALLNRTPTRRESRPQEATIALLLGDGVGAGREAARGVIDERRADRLGVPLTQLGQFSGAGGRLSARIAGAERSLKLIAERNPHDDETRRFVSAITDRLAALSAAVPAAENMPGPRRKAAQASIGEQLDGIEADLLARLGVL